MNKYHRQAANNPLLRLELYDSSSTVGALLGSLAFNTSGLVIEAQRELDAAKTSYTVAGSNVEDITTLGTYAAPTSGKVRFKETQLGGVYELHLAQALLGTADGSRYVDVKVYGAANLAPRVQRLWLTDINEQSSDAFVRMILGHVMNSPHICTVEGATAPDSFTIPAGHPWADAAKVLGMAVKPFAGTGAKQRMSIVVAFTPDGGAGEGVVQVSPAFATQLDTDTEIMFIDLPQQAAPVEARVTHVVDTELQGDGTVGNKWRAV